MNSPANLGRRKVEGFTQQAIMRPVIPGPEHNPWFWNPNRAGVRTAPPSFLERLVELGEELHCTWNPIKERWQVWARAPRMQHPICQGWKLLFVHSGPDGEYLPLDERVLARLYHASVLKYGSARQYFDALQREMERDREKQEAAVNAETLDMAMDYWNYTQVKNIGTGNKFSTYLA